MSIFTKQVQDVTFDDIAELESEGTRESTFLEFKEKVVGKEAMVKELSAFANTYGGYLIEGIRDDKAGGVAELCGTDPKPNYAQTLVNWCLEHIYPPIVPSVSAEIPHPDNDSRVFYVIHVALSPEAPHFLTQRRGCYVRIGEHSKPFEPKLAQYEEIQELTRRRREAQQTRQRSIDRAKRRFAAPQQTRFASVSYSSPAITLRFAAVPAFPGPHPFDTEQLRSYLKLERSRRTQMDEGTLPSNPPQSHHEGWFIDSRGKSRFSYLELDVHGLLFCGSELDEVNPDKKKGSTDLHIDACRLLLAVVRYLGYAERLYGALGYGGLLSIEIGMDGIQGRPLRMPSGTRIDTARLELTDEVETKAIFDNSFEFCLEKSSRQLHEEMHEIACEIFETICFACGAQDIRQQRSRTDAMIEKISPLL